MKIQYSVWLWGIAALLSVTSFLLGSGPVWLLIAILAGLNAYLRYRNKK